VEGRERKWSDPWLGDECVVSVQAQHKREQDSAAGHKNGKDGEEITDKDPAYSWLLLQLSSHF